MKSDEEIKEAIREFREYCAPEKRQHQCPFDKFNRVDDYDVLGAQEGCLVCKRIMGTLPHLHTLRVTEIAGRDYYSLDTGACPCILYGREYTVNKIKKFMGEI